MKSKYSHLLDHFLSTLKEEEALKNLKAYHSFFQEIEADLNELILKELKDHPIIGELLRKQSKEERVEQSKKSLQVQYDAIYNNNWEPFIEYQANQGIAYASMGMEYYMWYEVISMARNYMMQVLTKDDKAIRPDTSSIIKGMNHFFDITMCTIGEAYLDEKKELIKSRETTIMQQTKDILELSTPVIQIWNGIVMAPLIGALDSERTYNFKEVLLNKIVDTGSPVTLIDITGVPTIDTQTAQHLIETVKSVRLLGADVVLTGIRPSIAQTLVHLGITLPDITSCASLSEGLRIAFSKLDLKVESLNGKSNKLGL